MNDLSARSRALALVLESDPDAAAVLSLQLDVLGMESHCCRESLGLLQEVARRRPTLVVLGLDLEAGEDVIALLYQLAAQDYRGWVLLLSGVERKLAHIAVRVGHTLGLQMLGALDKPMRLPELRQCLGNPRLRRATAGPLEEAPVFTTEELERALSRGELTVHYQPQFELGSGRLSGAEALVRWQHPELGLVGPTNFLPLLTPLQSRRLTRHVLDRAQQDGAFWAQQGCLLSLSVNVTADDLMHPDLLALVGRRPAESPPLVLEITESAAMDDVLLGSEVAARLCLGGLEMAVDDFGVGFSSLSRLQLLPISELKIDRSFVCNFLETPQDAAIVESVALLGRRLGLRVVAEGIESLEALATLERFGCTHAQGYGLGRPMPAPKILELAATQDAMRASSRAMGAPPGRVP